MLAEKPDPTGETRARERAQGQALAGKRTLNRLAWSAAEVSEEERYQKIGLDFEAVDRMLVNVFLQAHRAAPKQIVRELESTDDPHTGRAGRVVR